MALTGSSEVYVNFTVTTEYSHLTTVGDLAKLMKMTVKDAAKAIEDDGWLDLTTEVFLDSQKQGDVIAEDFELDVINEA